MPLQLEIKDKSERKQLLKITPFNKTIRKTHPHKHNNYFEIVYLSKGKGVHIIDYTRYAIQSPMIFFIRKEQVHFWELKTVPKGYVLILKKEFLDKSLDGELKILFTKISGITALQINNANTIEQLFRLLMQEYEECKAQNFPVIEGILKILLAKTLQIAQPALCQTKVVGSNLFQAYIELLTESNHIQNNVAHYAALLNTTPQNLNAICRKQVNLSAAVVLAEHIINEAKRLLLYTDSTIATISFTLNFKDPSHFVKYFKRFTGETPRFFRKNN